MRFRMSSSALLLISLLLPLHTAGQSTQPSTASTSVDEQQMISAARSRADAFASGDCSRWAAYVDTDYRDIEGNATDTHEALLKECQQGHGSPDYKQKRVLSDFHFKPLGNIVVMDYLNETIEKFGEITFHAPARKVDVFERRQGHWIALLSVEVLKVVDPPVAKIDASALDNLAGQYAWVGASMLDTVTRKGDKLYVQSTGDDSPKELLPESANTFFVSGELSRVTFLRDKHGRVIEERQYSPMDQEGYLAKKVK